jgi:apolipoprotein N-acyltransferase
MPEARLDGLSGIKRYAAAFLAGAFMVLAMPPVGFFPVLFLCVPVLIRLAAASASRKAAFAAGWAFGAGYFIFGLYWVSAALFVDIGQWYWVLPLSLIAGPAILGLYFGLMPLVAYPLRRHRTAHALAFVATWALVEYVRGHALTGFPWNLPGQAWQHVPPLLQVASLCGIYGLSFLTLFWAAAASLRHSKAVLCVLAASFIAVFGFGAARLMLHPVPPATDAPVVRIVQADIPQSEKWDSDQEWRNIEKHIILSEDTAATGKTPAFVVWPETAVPVDMTQFPEVARAIAPRMPKGSIGIFGNLRITFRKEDSRPEAFYNSVAVFDASTAKVLAAYDKHHLVPFGEYIPWRSVIGVTPIAQAVSGIGDFTRGRGPQTLSVRGLPSFSPLVCYEVIFPDEVADPNNRPQWLVNVTNDGWYGRSAGPYQHLAIARLRAVEEGLPLARAANTGISAMIDPLGRITAELPLGTAGAIDAALPQALPPTPYSRLREGPFYLMVLLCFAAALWLQRKTQ